MANIVNIAQPVTGQDQAGRVRPQNPNEGNTSIYQMPDPSKVQKPQDQNVYADRQNNPFSPNLDSNFDKFLQKMRNTPELAKQYGEVFYSRMGNLVNSGMGENFTEEIAKYMEMLKMTDADLLAMMKGQQGTNLKFSGPFFDLMRQLMHGSGPNDLKLSILDFLRKYDSLTSNNHILKNIISNLDNIVQRLPRSIAAELEGMISGLQTNLPNGKNYVNLELLKGEIMPFLANYVGQTKDFGAVRDLITMLTLNLARYESGTQESFLQALRGLMGYSEVSERLQGVNVDALAARLSRMESGGNGLVDQLVSIIAKGAAGEAGFQNKAVFQNMMSSILVNESVYMPLLHLTLPADIGGNLFFAEMWIDPDDKSRRGGGEEEQAVKLLIKFDIKDLGYFEVVLLAQGGKVDMELFYPEALAAREREIRDGLTGILERNHMTFRSLLLGRMEKPKSISEVFPKLYERKNTINVTI